MKPTTRSITRIVTPIALAGLLTGCSVLGPPSVTADRFDYNTAISDSWKEQTLLNIVKLRYADMPLFLEVASIVAGYTLETEVSAGGVFPRNHDFVDDVFSAGLRGRFTDRPTITYSPITGKQFNTSFMTPIKPRSVLFLIQSGWPVDLVFPITVDSMNGLRNQVAGGLNQRRGDDAFFQVLTRLRQLQLSGAVGMRIKQAEEQETTMLLFHRDGVSPEVTTALDELTELLGMDPTSKEARVTYSQIPEQPNDLAMLTRSTFQIMVDLATQVEVPEEHVEEGRAMGSFASEENSGSRSIRIRSSRWRPNDAFVSVPYKDHWYYIDDRDFKSKRTFGFLMIIFSLTETGGDEALPLVTIPAG